MSLWTVIFVIDCQEYHNLNLMLIKTNVDFVETAVH